MAVVPVIAGPAGRNSEGSVFLFRLFLTRDLTHAHVPPPPGCAGACLGCVIPFPSGSHLRAFSRQGSVRFIGLEPDSRNCDGPSIRRRVCAFGGGRSGSRTGVSSIRKLPAQFPKIGQVNQSGEEEPLPCGSGGPGHSRRGGGRDIPAPSGPLRICRKTSSIVIQAALPFSIPPAPNAPDGEL